MENSNKKLMFITLGTGSGVSHGILFSIKKQNPDIIIFIASIESIKTYDEIVNNLSDKPFEIIKEDCPEVNDIEIIYKNFSAIIKKYINKGFTKENIVVDYTSGTKAMSAAIVAVAIANGFSNFSYVSGERDIGGRVLSGTERLNSLTVNRIVTENYLRLFLVFFNKNQFDLALGVLDQINEVHPDFEEKVNLYKLLTKSFSHWEKFDFKKSFELLDSINPDVLAKYGLKKKIESSKQLLYKLKNDENNQEKVVELVSNAKRRAEEGKYDDAVARLYRALEMIAQIEFTKMFNCKTSDVIAETIPEDFREEINQKYFDSKDGKIKLPLFATFDILNKVNNETGKRFFTNYDAVKKILHLRNNSILAHGNGPLSEKEFKDSLKIIEVLTDLFNQQNSATNFLELR